MKSLESSQPITPTIIMAIISLLSLYTALHSHAQLSVVMTTWLTNVCAEPNSESACVAILGLFQSELEIEPFPDFGRLSLKRGQRSVM